MNYVVNSPAQLKPILIGYRKSQGMSQKVMAEKLNVSQQAYQALESNPQSATFERLMKVLNTLGVKLYLSDTPLSSSLNKPNTQQNETHLIINEPATSLTKVEVITNNAPSNKITKKLRKDSW